ncbi:MAG: hypothetical protein ACRDQ5_15585, partial [Sciscionella sp.]
MAIHTVIHELAPWSAVDRTPERAVIWLRRGISRDGAASGSRATPSPISSDPSAATHQQRPIKQRRVTLDPETVLVLSDHRERCRAKASAPGMSLTGTDATARTAE